MSTPETNRHEQARRLLEQLIEISPDENIRDHAVKLHRRLALPIDDILSKVPGETVMLKAKKLGVTRQVIYGWMSGEYRPSGRQARRLARITGYAFDDIRGRGATA